MSYTWPPPQWSWWLLLFYAFKPQFSLAQQTMPFCLNTIINEPGHKNITHGSTRPYRFKIIPLQTPAWITIFYPRGRKMLLCSLLRAMHAFIWLCLDVRLSFSASSEWKVEQIPNLTDRNMLLHPYCDSTYLHRLSVNLGRDCIMWFYNSLWTVTNTPCLPVPSQIW